MLDYNIKIDGIMPVIVQDYENNEVLTLGYINKEAYDKSMETGYMHYYSRSKKRIRMKGEASGNVQTIKEVKLDCDGDALLIKVIQKGPACHLGTRSCFQNIDAKPNYSNINYSLETLLDLQELIYNTKEKPRENSYTSELFASGEENIRKKVGEEAVETVLAQGKERIIYETADLLYHLLVFLSYNNIKIEEVMNELDRRNKMK